MADRVDHTEDLAAALGAALAWGIRYLLIDLEDMGAFLAFVCICRHNQSTPVSRSILAAAGLDNLRSREAEIKSAGANVVERVTLVFYKFKRDKALLTLKGLR